jgi:hypothetical protein
MRSEEEVNKMIEDLQNRTKGKYITQGVSFNKTCPRQMELLKNALMQSASFSGLAKEMLALRFSNKVEHNIQTIPQMPQSEAPKTKNYGNFI